MDYLRTNCFHFYELISISAALKELIPPTIDFNFSLCHGLFHLCCTIWTDPSCISSLLLDFLSPFFCQFLLSPFGLEERFLSFSLYCLVMEVLSKIYSFLPTCVFVKIFLCPLHPLLSKALPACFWSPTFVKLGLLVGGEYSSFEGW